MGRAREREMGPETGKKKERWGLTILLFLLIVGIFSFLLFKGGRTVVSDELVLAVRRDKTSSDGVLYNYHPVRAASSKAAPQGSGRETTFDAPGRGEGQPVIEGGYSPAEGKPGKAASGGRTTGTGKIPGFIYHKVQSGESLWKIAKRYNADIGDIVKDNSIRDPNIIYAGATLKITLKLT